VKHEKLTAHVNNLKFPDYQQVLFADQADSMELTLLV